MRFRSRSHVAGVAALASTAAVAAFARIAAVAAFTRIAAVAAFTRIAAVAALAALAAGLAPAVVIGQAPRDTIPLVTLAEARVLAGAVAPGAVAAREQVEEATWERRAATADLLSPNLRAATSYIRFSEPFFNFGTGSVSPSATSATLQASYTLFGARKFAELNRSRASLESAQASETAAHFRTAFVTDRIFFAALSNGELSRVARDRLRRAEEQLGVARVRVVAGEAVASDSLQLVLEVSRARLAVLRADSALAVSRLRLGRQIGQSGPADAAPIDTTTPPPLPITREQAVAELRSSGPDILAARAEERRASAALGVQRNAYLPEISLDAVMGAYDAEFFPSALRRRQFGVTVSVPLWTGGQRELAIARARAQRNVSRAEREDRERATAEAIAATYYGYETARAAIELAQVGVTAAAENYRVQRARYAEGASTILDLLEAQVALSESEVALVQARYAARLALAELEALLGRRVIP